jgi:glycosyltransferase involved in cell wall biosynthesis
MLWLTAYLTALVLRIPIHLYSEVWIEPRGVRQLPARWLRGRVRRSAARVLVPSEAHRDFLVAAGVPADRIARIDSIYCPVPPAARLLPVRRRGSFTFLYVGRLTPYKGLLRLLDLMPRVLAGAPVRLIVVAGRAAQYMGSQPAYAERCRERIERLPRDLVELREHTDDIDSVYAQADALVMPNLIIPDDRVPAEAWGRVVEEALYHGLPVISTDAVPAARELVTPGVNGYVVPWRDDAQLEEAMATAAARPAERQA